MAILIKFYMHIMLWDWRVKSLIKLRLVRFKWSHRHCDMGLILSRLKNLWFSWNTWLLILVSRFTHQVHFKLFEIFQTSTSLLLQYLRVFLILFPLLLKHLLGNIWFPKSKRHSVKENTYAESILLVRMIFSS